VVRRRRRRGRAPPKRWPTLQGRHSGGRGSRGRSTSAGYAEAVAQLLPVCFDLR
jgi:hypothetical protein